MPYFLARLIGIVMLACAAGTVAFAADRPVVRVGVLQFGTVSWELETMQRHGLHAQLSQCHCNQHSRVASRAEHNARVA